MEYSCTGRCPECPTRHNPELGKNVVPGDGPDNARVMVVLEGPGKLENNFKRPACGNTGDELDNTYLPRAGLSRPEVWVTNTFKCHWADSGDTPPERVIRSCAEYHLRQELAEVRPKYLILSGGVPNSLAPKSMEMQHGLMYWGKYLGWEGWIFPTYHPARGFHKSNDMQALLDDFTDFKGFRRGEIKPLKFEVERNYRRIQTVEDVQDAMYDAQDWNIAIDTESEKTWKGYKSTIRYKPWCLTASNRDDSAFMIRVTDKPALSEFSRCLRRYHKVIMHNAPHDVGILGEMGVEVEWGRIHDTMSMAYHDARTAKGLKYLCYKNLGMTMRSFDDVVVPYGEDRALRYFIRARDMAWSVPDQEPTGEYTTSNCPTCKGHGTYATGRGSKRLTGIPCLACVDGRVTKPRMTRKQGIGQKINRLLGDLEKGPVDMWARWEGWKTAVDELIESIGPVPLPSIEFVPEDEAIEYACGDAHGTRLLWPIMKRRIVGIRRMVR